MLNAIYVRSLHLPSSRGIMTSETMSKKDTPRVFELTKVKELMEVVGHSYEKDGEKSVEGHPRID